MQAEMIIEVQEESHRFGKALGIRSATKGADRGHGATRSRYPRRFCLRYVGYRDPNGGQAFEHLSEASRNLGVWGLAPDDSASGSLISQWPGLKDVLTCGTTRSVVRRGNRFLSDGTTKLSNENVVRNLFVTKRGRTFALVRQKPDHSDH